MIDATLIPALQDVLAVARTGSVGAAAKRLHKTPSAVSQQLRRVDEHFHIELFERAGRGVKLSPAGEAALVAVTRLFDEAESLFGLLADLSGEPVTTLRIAASDYLGKGLLAPVVRELVTQGAPVRFEIVTTHSHEATRWVERGEVDLAIVTSDEPRPLLDEHALFAQPFFWVSPKSKRDSGRSLRERLAKEPLLRLAPGSEGRRLLDAYLERERIRPSSTIDVPNVSLMLSYVSAGIGVGLAPALALLDPSVANLHREPAPVPVLPVKLIARKNFRPNRTTDRLISRLLEEGTRAEGWIRQIKRTGDGNLQRPAKRQRKD